MAYSSLFPDNIPFVSDRLDHAEETLTKLNIESQ